MLCGLAAILILAAGCAAPEDPAMRPFRVNPFPTSSPEAEHIKYPPGGGTGAYWMDGRFNLTLDNFNDESIQGDKAIFPETLCFRQEGARVFAKNKAGFLMVLDLATQTMKKDKDLNAFTPEEQAIFSKLSSHSRGTIRIAQTTLMPDL